jgi:putative two-component system response regulator
VDQHQNGRPFFAELLRQQGHDVITTTDAGRSLQTCAVLQPDIILLDDSHGHELCRQLKADPRNRLTPVLLVSRSSERALAPEQTGGADGVLTKPLSTGAPLHRIQSFLDVKAYIDEQAESVLLSLARSIEARDAYTQGHCERLADLAAALGNKLRLPDELVQALRIAGIVHDIGKVAVPDAILSKPGKLTREEMEVMQTHPTVGEHICAPLKVFREVLPIIRHHHERMNGSGYPDGLEGERIPLTARILQTVDIFDALTTNRPYRKALSSIEALAMMRGEGQRGLTDLELVDELETLLRP